MTRHLNIALLLGASPAAAPDLAAAASPVTYLHPGQDLPPFFIAHGDADCVVPYQQSVQLHEAIEVAAPGRSQLTVVPGSGHYLEVDFESQNEALGAFLTATSVRTDRTVACKSSTPGTTSEHEVGPDQARVVPRCHRLIVLPSVASIRVRVGRPRTDGIYRLARGAESDGSVIPSGATISFGSVTAFIAWSLPVVVASVISAAGGPGGRVSVVTIG